jgi:hypothetical protein
MRAVLAVSVVVTYLDLLVLSEHLTKGADKPLSAALHLKIKWQCC